MKERLVQIGSAAAGIAHDINNQLTLILNHLAGCDIESAREAIFRCSALTSTLLSYCRGESIMPETVDLTDFLLSFTGNLRLPPGIRLIVDAPAGLPKIAGDPAALGRVLSNLVLNACDAMGSVGILRISALPRIIEVSDSGPGIAPENVTRIFDAFFSTKGAAGGGLGLAIVREIMRQHRGSVTVSSEPGCGASFQLRFHR